MDRSTIKKVTRRVAGTYGRTHGPTNGNSKRAANKAARRIRDENLRDLGLVKTPYGWE